MTTTIYLTRHGQTEWNVEGKMQGWEDSTLTSLGVQQAQWLKELFMDMNIDVIYSSSSGRAYNTAKIVNEDKNININTDDNLREIKLGKMQGLTQEEIKSMYQKEYFYYYNKPSAYIPVGDGETFSELFQRASETLSKIVNDNEGKKILIVTHTMIIKAIICWINKRPIDEFWDKPYIRQGSLTTILIENGEFKLTKCADISHHKFLVKEFNEK